MLNDTETVTYEDLEATDVISVELVPERKGLILKHCEYYVSSRRHGTTVTRRYNDFAQLYAILSVKYPYRAVCRLPPKRVVVGGGSAGFLSLRRAALQRWLALAARHPVLAHDADLRAFLCEPHPTLDRPKHDEFQLAGTQQQDSPGDLSIDEMQAQFVREQELLRVIQLGLNRLSQIFEKVATRCLEEHASFLELGAGLQALGQRGGEGNARWSEARERLADAAQLAIQMGESPDASMEDEVDGNDGRWAVNAALDALQAYRELGARLSRGLHGERAAAASAHAHAHHLRNRHRYALMCALQEGGVARAYALWALERIPSHVASRAEAHRRLAQLWGQLHNALQTSPR